MEEACSEQAGQGSAFSALLEGLAAEHAHVQGENEKLRYERSCLYEELDRLGLTGVIPDVNGKASSSKDDSAQASHPLSGRGVVPLRPCAPPIRRPEPPPPLPPGSALRMAGNCSASSSIANGPPEPPALRANTCEHNHNARKAWDLVREMYAEGKLHQEAAGPGANGEVLEMNPLWRTASKSLRRPISNSSNSSQDSAESSAKAEAWRSSSKEKRIKRAAWHDADLKSPHYRRCLQRIVMKPDDQRRLVWDVFSLIFLAYDCLSTPMEVFDLPETTWRMVLGLVSLCFWTSDIFVSFITGYHTVKSLELRLSRIGIHYLQTWFFVDFSIILLEWLSFGGASIFRFGKVTRGARVLRMLPLLKVVRMLRLVKVQALFEQFTDYIRSETTLMAFQISRLVIFILSINHLVACGWWAVGTYADTDDTRWTRKAMEADDGLVYSYLTSLHWALTQFTPASMEVFPTNAWERGYTIMVLMMGLGAFSSFVASISSLMTQLRQLKATQHREDLLVRRYLAEHNISLELGNRIMFFFRDFRKSAKRNKLTEGDVRAFTDLPDNLRVKLRWEVFEPSITPHPLFYHLDAMDHSGLVEICNRCMSERHVGQGNEVFHRGMHADRMYFIGEGTLAYQAGQPRKGAEQVAPIGGHQWIAEMVLWMNWIHRGTLTATGFSELVELHAVRFHEHVRHREICFDLCKCYARLYVEEIAKDLEDFPEDDWGSVDRMQSMVHRSSDSLHRTKFKRSMTGMLNKLLSLFSETKVEPESALQGRSDVEERS